MSLIINEVREGTGILTFNNEAKRNCLSLALLGELHQALAALEQAKARAVILRAAPGAKVWSAGFNIEELSESGRDPLGYNDPLEKVLRAVQRFPAPVIAMIEGGVFGGACELAMVCDVLVAAPSASFAITPAKIGVPYNIGGITHFINVVGVHIAKEMFFTAQPVSSERAMQIGMLNHLVPAAELEAFTLDMARTISKNSPLSIAVIKEQFRILTGSHPLSPETFERVQGLRRLVYDSQDYQEGRRAFLEKRAPVFRGE
jgi:methylmalonyl-CoA decarboxylase